VAAIGLIFFGTCFVAVAVNYGYLGLGLISGAGLLVGVLLIVLMWVRWRIQAQAIRHGVQAVATVYNVQVVGHGGPQAQGPDTWRLDAHWVGNNEVTYTFHTIPRNASYYSSWTHWTPEAWLKKKVRLYIDRNNPQRYYLDDIPIPEQQTPEQTVPAFNMAQYKRRAWTKTIIIAVVVLAVLLSMWIIPVILSIL